MFLTIFLYTVLCFVLAAIFYSLLEFAAVATKYFANEQLVEYAKASGFIDISEEEMCSIPRHKVYRFAIHSKLDAYHVWRNPDSGRWTVAKFEYSLEYPYRKFEYFAERNEAFEYAKRKALSLDTSSPIASIESAGGLLLQQGG